MFVVPPAARVACWLNAWLAGRESADAVISGLMGDRAAVQFTGIASEPLPPALLLGELRRRRVAKASVALPLPGDPIGLAGPPGFNADALEAGQAVVLHGLDVGLVPESTGAATSWVGATANRPVYLPDVGSAARSLRDGLRVAAERLVELDVAAWSPDVADALMNLRTPASLDCVMPFPSGDAARTAVDGLRAREIVDLALRDEGGAVSAHEAARRREALQPLRHSALAAVVAACSSFDGR